MRRAFFYIVLILVIAWVNNTSGQSNPTEQSWKKIAEKGIMYPAFAKDITEMAKAQLHKKDINEFHIASELSASAGQAGDYFSAASDLIWIYDQINATSDNVKVRSYINKRLDYYSQMLKHNIKLVNLNLSFSTSAGIAATGTRLRDELRDGQSLLETTKIR